MLASAHALRHPVAPHPHAPARMRPTGRRCARPHNPHHSRAMSDALRSWAPWGYVGVAVLGILVAGLLLGPRGPWLPVVREIGTSLKALAAVGREGVDVMRHYGEQILQSQHRAEDGIYRVRELLGDPKLDDRTTLPHAPRAPRSRRDTLADEPTGGE